MSVLNLFRLTGKVAIVTGAARGLGRQSALALAEAGSAVAICDLLDEQGEATAAELRALGGKAIYAHVDVTQSVAIQAFVERVAGELGPVDILVNNVGIGSGGRSLEDEEDERWRNIIDVNLSSMFYVAKPVVRAMIERGQGGRLSTWLR